MSGQMGYGVEIGAEILDSLAHQVLGTHWIFSLSSACSVGELAGLYWGTGAPAAPGQASTAQALH